MGSGKKDKAWHECCKQDSIGLTPPQSRRGDQASSEDTQTHPLQRVCPSLITNITSQLLHHPLPPPSPPLPVLALFQGTSAGFLLLTRPFKALRPRLPGGPAHPTFPIRPRPPRLALSCRRTLPSSWRVKIRLLGMTRRHSGCARRAKQAWEPG